MHEYMHVIVKGRNRPELVKLLTSLSVYFPPSHYIEMYLICLTCICSFKLTATLNAQKCVVSV